MWRTPGWRFPKGADLIPVSDGTFSFSHCAIPAMPDLSVTMTRMGLPRIFSVSKML